MHISFDIPSWIFLIFGSILIFGFISPFIFGISGIGRTTSKDSLMEVFIRHSIGATIIGCSQYGIWYYFGYPVSAAVACSLFVGFSLMMAVDERWTILRLREQEKLELRIQECKMLGVPKENWPTT